MTAQAVPNEKGAHSELFDFSGDEVIALFASGGVSVLAVGAYYSPLTGVTTLAGGRMIRCCLALLPPICLALLLPVLLHLTSHEVRADRGYVILFLLAGVVWLAMAVGIAAALGISYRDDALERRNAVAAVALSGAMLGSTAIYAGANIGEGATIWMTFGPAVLGTAGWAIAWMIYQAAGDAAEAVAVERDISSGLRLAGLLIAMGLILGRAVAGHYESLQRTMEDFAVQGWPVLPLALIAAVVQRIAMSRRRLRLGWGWSGALIGLLYMCASLGWLLYLGAPIRRHQ